jgi:hypothetical protein
VPFTCQNEAVTTGDERGPDGKQPGTDQQSGSPPLPRKRPEKEEVAGSHPGLPPRAPRRMGCRPPPLPQPLTACAARDRIFTSAGNARS